MKTQNLSLAEKAGKNLKNLIKQSQYRTQENFAIQFSTDPSTVRRWIHNGINNINTIKQIADFLDVDFLELLK